MKRELDDLITIMKNARNGEWDDDGLDTVLEESIKVFTKINNYINTHGNIALSCGSEWMYQDDKGQENALELVGNILDSLEKYAKIEDEE